MRSFSLISMSMSGVRIAGELGFTPAHYTHDGGMVNDRVGVPVISNSRRRDKFGKEKRSSNFKLVGWGGRARALCRFGSTGKALDVIVEPHSYEGGIYKLAPSPSNPSEMTPQAVIVGGQVLTTEKVGFRIVDISYGEESAKQIQRELEKWASEPGCLGGRPPQWNVVGSSDAAQFAQILDQRKTMAWDCQSPFFGFARVILPRNAQRILNIQERAAIEENAKARRAPVTAQTPVTVPVAPVTSVGQVQATFAPTPQNVVNPLTAGTPTPGVIPATTAIAAPVSGGF